MTKNAGRLNPKYPGGTEPYAALLEAEGHTILPGKGKKPPRMADVEKTLI